MGSKRPRPAALAPPIAQQSSSTSANSFSSLHKPEKPSARSTVGSGRTWTISIAIPSSILLNCQSLELKLALCSQIARSCAIFSVDEIVIFNDGSNNTREVFKPKGKFREVKEEEEEDPGVFLVRILRYLETPQYLRKSLFPLHPSLRLIGILPPLDCPHHLRRDDLSPFREAVIVENESGEVKVDIGQWETLIVGNGKNLEVGERVTVRMPEDGYPIAQIVESKTPTTEVGLYWGYSVRSANSLAQVFSESPYANSGGYDLSIGTSERGNDIEEILSEVEPFKHGLLTFGPLSGLELTIANDAAIPLAAEEASDLFDYWINVIVGQGSRTVRTEEALPISLARLRSTMEKQGTAGTR